MEGGRKSHCRERSAGVNYLVRLLAAIILHISFAQQIVKFSGGLNTH